MSVLPVTVLSGFLGAGKTTLINHLLRHPGGRRLAVLVNDLAEVNVDGLKLKAGRTRLRGSRPPSDAPPALGRRPPSSYPAVFGGDSLGGDSLGGEEPTLREEPSGDGPALGINGLHGVKGPHATEGPHGAERPHGAEELREHHKQRHDDSDLGDSGEAEGEPTAPWDDGFVELHNGCICCTLREDFIREVSRLARTGRFDALLVEATGVAEPLPVAMAFDLADPEGQLLGSIARIDSMITVVDAFNFMADWEKAEELSQLGLAIDSLDNRTIADLLAEQVEYANQIIINKTDLVPAQKLKELEELLRCLNPEAQILRSMFGMVDPELVVDTGLFAIGDIAGQELSQGEPTTAAGTHPEEADRSASQKDAPDEGHHEVSAKESPSREPLHEDLGITSFVYRSRRPFHPERLWAYLGESWPGVLRSKGLFWLATRMNDSGLWSQAGKACSHHTAGRWWSSLPDDHLPDDEGLRQSILAEFRGPFGDRRQEIVIIGRHLDQQAIRQKLDACLLDGSEMQLGPMGWRQLPDPFPAWETENFDETEIVVPALRRETPSA